MTRSIVYSLVSPPMTLTYTGSAPPGSASFERWTFREQYEPPQLDNPLRKRGRYQVAIERAVETTDEPQRFHYDAIDLAERMQKVWPYATGVAIMRAPIARRLQLVTPPEHWKSNFDDVQMQLVVAKGGGTLISGVSGGTVAFSEIDWWPLERIVTALRAEVNLSDVEREMIELHDAANRSPSERAYSVLLSSALEIARELLPGDSKAEKQRLLSAAIPELLTQPLDKLFARANQHRETRHAITKVPVLRPHPPMIGDDLINYLRDVDAIIRYVICTRLGLDSVRVGPG